MGIRDWWRRRGQRQYTLTYTITEDGTEKALANVLHRFVAKGRGEAMMLMVNHLETRAALTAGVYFTDVTLKQGKDTVWGPMPVGLP